MEESQGFLANRIEKTQGYYIPNDNPRASIHKLHDWGAGGWDGET